ncbi:MAG: 23S rRNA (adenine(2503)-C(2))-methyltransferase RlmN [Proteobacteria bacterium]|nr:23S rRNA (adenine(2503)-C(2))-methyltransferase RlmN [Pseudomonadota bacterium]MBU1714787.1 23S rRNA (adenine(2503)-C(2))-methyltransferase RlmN [Pseudomonadota bacterium]
MKKVDLKNFSISQLTNFVRELDFSPFRARQIFSWLYRPGFNDFNQMTDLSKKAREALAERSFFSSLSPDKSEESSDGAVKFRFRLEDGLMIESVFIPEEDRNTLCISSQAGCAMGCDFCLTGAMGFKRNLTPAEIVNQVLAVMKAACHDRHNSEEPARRSGCINNLVFMGMGEPLANFDNLVTAIDILMDQRGLDFSSRRITVSTCGLVPKMIELGEKTSVNLAISLHSIRDEVRSRLMPVNRKYPVAVLLDACRQFPLPPRRMIMMEYIMIKDLNDSPAEAHELAEKLKDIRCKINLLPYNENPNLNYKRPSSETILRFQKILWDAGYSVFIRSSRGADISAACGQLAGDDQ